MGYLILRVHGPLSSARTLSIMQRPTLALLQKRDTDNRLDLH